MLQVLHFVVIFLGHNSRGSSIAHTSGPQYNCSCKRENGMMINLESLQRTDGKPRFSLSKDGYNYTYNPCFPFKLGPADDPNYSNCQDDVALCESYDANFWLTIGTQSSVACTITAEGPKLVYQHARPDFTLRTSVVLLKCDPKKTSILDAVFEVIDAHNWIFRLTHSVCCWATSSSAPTPTDKTVFYVGVGCGAVGLVMVIALIVYIKERCGRRPDPARVPLINPAGGRPQPTPRRQIPPQPVPEVPVPVPRQAPEVPIPQLTPRPRQQQPQPQPRPPPGIEDQDPEARPRARAGHQPHKIANAMPIIPEDQVGNPVRDSEGAARILYGACGH